MAKSIKAKFKCFCCGKEYVETNYYKSFSDFYSSMGKIPYCKQCIEKFYNYYYNKYKEEGCVNAEQEAVKRICMAFNLYYNARVFNFAMNDAKKRNINISPLSAYMKMIQLRQNNGKTYDDSIEEMSAEEQAYFISKQLDTAENGGTSEIDEKTINFFGVGFTNEDYVFLKREYADWTARHECNTKAQEEVFKRICFKQLEILKATRKGEDTKNLDATFQNYLDTAKLQPKQNANETTADNQTFGTLIDKWENTRPLPEIDEELKDVDKIGYYIDTFFKGHTCKMLNVKNAFSNLYSSMMKKFTVKKPEYNLDEDDYDSEINFDTIFGDKLSEPSEE